MWRIFCVIYSNFHARVPQEMRWSNLFYTRMATWFFLAKVTFFFSYSAANLFLLRGFTHSYRKFQSYLLSEAQCMLYRDVIWSMSPFLHVLLHFKYMLAVCLANKIEKTVEQKERERKRHTEKKPTRKTREWGKWFNVVVSWGNVELFSFQPMPHNNLDGINDVNGFFSFYIALALAEIWYFSTLSQQILADINRNTLFKGREAKKKLEWTCGHD